MSRSTIPSLSPPPAEIAAAVEAVRQQLAQAQTLDRRGDSEAARAVVLEAVREAERLRYPALHAEAVAQHARLLDGSQSADVRDQVEDLYHTALAIAEAAQHHQLIATIWSRLVLLAIQLDSGTQEAQLRWDHARALPSAGDTAYEQARLFHLQGEIYYRDGKYAQAADAQRTAIATIANAPDHQLELSRYNDALAKSLRHLGELAEAIALHERAIDLAAPILNHGHPDLLKLRMNFGLTLYKVDWKEARAEARSVLSGALACIAESDRGSYLDAGIIHGALSELSYAEGKPEEARAFAQQSLQVYQGTKAPRHRMAEAYTNLGNADLKLKRFEGACASYARALGYRLGYLADNHHQIGVNHGSLAEALVGLERHGEALVHVSAAQRILGHSSAHDRDVQAWIAMVHGEVLIGLNQPKRAVAYLEGALRSYEAVTDPDPDPCNHASTAWALARALHRLDRCPERVKPLAEQACALFARLGPHDRVNYLAVQQFLEQLAPDGSGPPGHHIDISQDDRQHVSLEPSLDDDHFDNEDAHDTDQLAPHAASGLR